MSAARKKKTGSVPAPRPRQVARPRLRSRDGLIDVTVVLLEGGHPSTAIGPIEVFDAAGVLWNVLHGEAMQPRFRVRTASIDGEAVTGLSSLGLTPQCSIHDIKSTDIVILSTTKLGMQDHVARSTPILSWLRKWHARGAYIAGICTSVALLAESGLLDGRRATTHWAVAESLRQRYPKVDWRPDQFVTEDGSLFCSGGVYASIDVSLYLVEKFCGHEVALQAARSLLVSMPRGRQTGYAVVPLSRPHDDGPIREAEEYLQQNFDCDVSIDGLAGRSGMSPRNFIRRFKAATGSLPGAYVQALRIAAAKTLLEQGATSIQVVSAKSGYDDVAFFRGLFRRHTGMTPAEYRSRFARMGFRRNGGLAGGAD